MKGEKNPDIEGTPNHEELNIWREHSLTIPAIHGVEFDYNKISNIKIKPMEYE